MLTRSQLGLRTAAPGPTPPGVTSGAKLLFLCLGVWPGVYTHGHTGHVPFKWEAPLRGAELHYQREELTQATIPSVGRRYPHWLGPSLRTGLFGVGRVSITWRQAHHRKGVRAVDGSRRQSPGFPAAKVRMGGRGVAGLDPLEGQPVSWHETRREEDSGGLGPPRGSWILCVSGSRRASLGAD